MRVFLAGDGSSDKVLQFHASGCFASWTDVLFLPEPSRPQPLRNRLEEALKDEPDLLLVHRDAEKELWKDRRGEIEAAVQSLEAAQGRTVANLSFAKASHPEHPEGSRVPRHCWIPFPAINAGLN